MYIILHMWEAQIRHLWRQYIVTFCQMRHWNSTSVAPVPEDASKQHLRANCFGATATALPEIREFVRIYDSDYDRRQAHSHADGRSHWPYWPSLHTSAEFTEDCPPEMPSSDCSLWFEKLDRLPGPIGSMYGIYANIWGILMVNVTIYSIHGSYGGQNESQCTQWSRPYRLVVHRAQGPHLDRADASNLQRRLDELRSGTPLPIECMYIILHMLHILRLLIYNNMYIYIYIYTNYIYIYILWIYSSLSRSIRLWTTNKHIPWSRTSVAKNVRPHIHFAVNLYKDYDSRRGIWPGGLRLMDNMIWLVVWNMFLFSPIVGMMIQSDFHIFQGVETTN